MSEAVKAENMIPVDDGFVIDTDAKAAWAMKKIKEARDDRDTFVAWYKGKIKEIEEQTEFNTMAGPTQEAS